MSKHFYSLCIIVLIDGLIRPGYIAGVTNPIFESRPGWWDILCNISTGKITVSSEIEFPKGIQTNAEMEASKNSDRDKDWMRVGYWEGDNDLIVDVCVFINSVAVCELKLYLGIFIYSKSHGRILRSSKSL